ncbi:MAG: hypothetical protein WEC81_02050 [Patescibacteria group bacterium]
MEKLLENEIALRLLSLRVQTIADALLVTTDRHFVLGRMADRDDVVNRLKGEYHVPGTGVSDASEKDIPSALRLYLASALWLQPELLDVIGVSYREPDDRFVRHIHYWGRINLTANEAEKEARPGLDLSHVVIVTGCKAVELIASSKVAFERTPKVFQTMFNSRD